MYVQETYVNATQGHMIGETPWEDVGDVTRGEVYRRSMEEYGRCAGKVYIDTTSGTKAVGWVFQGRDRYEDTREIYLREVWVTVRED